MRKSFFSSSLVAVALAGFSCGAAQAVEIPYSAAVGGVEVTGTVEMDDSSGDANSASGTASGVVNGKFALDGANTQSEIPGTGSRLVVNFSHASQRLSAHLDSCPASPDNCTAGPLVLLWEK